jgi:hypothetical protein
VRVTGGFEKELLCLFTRREGGKADIRARLSLSRIFVAFFIRGWVMSIGIGLAFRAFSCCRSVIRVGQDRMQVNRH